MYEFNLRLLILLTFLAFSCVLLNFSAPVHALDLEAHPSQRSSLFAVDGGWLLEVDVEDGASFWGTNFGQINSEINQLVNQSFFYRLGSTGGELPLSTLELASSFESGNSVILSYGNPDFDPMGVTLTYELDAASDTESSVEIGMSITNFGLEPLNLHWFAFSNLELDHAFSVDTATFQSIGSIRQVSSINSQVDVEAGTEGLPDAWEIAEVDTLLDRLTDNQPTTLTNQSVTFGPGNVAQAFQWSTSIASLDTVALSLAMSANVARLIYPLPSANNFPFEDDTPSTGSGQPSWYLPTLSPDFEFLDFRTTSGPNFASVIFPAEFANDEFSIWIVDDEGSLVEIAVVGGLEAFDFTTLNPAGTRRFFLQTSGLPEPGVLPAGLTMISDDPVEFLVTQLDDSIFLDAFLN